MYAFLFYFTIKWGTGSVIILYIMTDMIVDFFFCPVASCELRGGWGQSETPQPDQEEGPAPKRMPSALVNLLGKTFTGVTVVCKSASTRAEEELKKYLEALPLSLSENPLCWWRTHEADFPLLAGQAKRFLCIPGTSVAAERVFSTAGRIVTAQWSNLTTTYVDQLLFLQKNLDVAPANAQ